MKRRSMSTACTVLMIGGALSYAIVFGTVVTRAQALCCAIEPLIRGPQSLKGVPVPEPPDLGDFVMDRQAAIVLGKALFWDMNAGSDEVQACASCHFTAGADTRIKNELNPDLRKATGGAASEVFDPMASGGVGGPNYTLKASDFPFHRLADPTNRDSAVLFSSDDVVGPQGVQATNFVQVAGTTEYTSNQESIFHVGTVPNDVNTRLGVPRNAPTVINAAYNFRNFWDGRASNEFNGVSPFGRRDTGARIWVTNASGVPSAIAIALKNASAASQAVGPITSNFEMSAAGRTLPDVGRKMLARRALSKQTVDPTDSVLGSHVYLNPTTGQPGLGLNETYKQLVQKAFWPKYWNATNAKFSAAAGTGYTHMEQNFSLYWGLSIMLYEETLVSDDSRFDRFDQGQFNALTHQELTGLQLFLGAGQCAECHKGPELTAAATNLQFEDQTGGLVEHMFLGDPTLVGPPQVNEIPQGPISLYDQGFYNLGVTPTVNDLGVGGTDDFGNPLSFAREYTGALQGQTVNDSFFINPCTFSIGTCEPVSPYAPRVAVDGAFKMPTLRNVELTGPYFHNGGYATLESVVDFYFRGGNRRLLPTGGDTTGYGGTDTNLDADIRPLGLGPADRDAIVAFLKSLTDERVRWEMAPFDHPSLKVPNGHPGDEYAITQVNSDGTAKDTLLAIPAVGSAGRAAKGLAPLQPFTPKP
jgi:cytochrome c peroxidase